MYINCLGHKNLSKWQLLLSNSSSACLCYSVTNEWIIGGIFYGRTVEWLQWWCVTNRGTKKQSDRVLDKKWRQGVYDDLIYDQGFQKRREIFAQGQFLFHICCCVFLARLRFLNCKHVAFINAVTFYWCQQKNYSGC